MERIVFYKVETAGLPVWSKPSDSPEQPHLVHVAAILCEANGEIVKTLDLTVKPNGWDISKEVSDIHGVTAMDAVEVGHDEAQVVDQLVRLCEGAKRVAWGESFDQRMVRIALKRHASPLCVDRWAGLESECAKKMAVKATGDKKIKLHAPMPEGVTGCRTMVHVNACMDLYFKGLAK